jgi:hypothetical protein
VELRIQGKSDQEAFANAVSEFGQNYLHVSSAIDNEIALKPASDIVKQIENNRIRYGADTWDKQDLEEPVPASAPKKKKDPK